MSKIDKWRKKLEDLFTKGEALEAAGRDLPGEFCVRPQWPGIDWVEIGIDLVEFAKRVTLVKEVLGPPDECEGKHWLGAYEGRAPDLVATWKRYEPFPYEITVRALMPTGCMVDPRTEYQKGQETKIHPQCAAVLRGLEDDARPGTAGTPAEGREVK